MKYLIVNADDFGNYTSVNEGILYGIEKGVITSTSVMITRKHTEDIEKLKQFPAISVGLHFEMPKGGTPVIEEFEKQIALFTNLMGRKPDHFDSHKIRPKDINGLVEFLGKYSKENSMPIRDWGHANLIDKFFGLNLEGTGSLTLDRVTPNGLIKALEILSEMGLLEFLTDNFGETHVVGSVELDLMVWRDIDIEVIATNKPTKENAISVAGFIYKNEHVRRVTPIDYTDGDGVKKPKGQYVGAEYVENGNKWKLDVWLLDKQSSRSFEVTNTLKGKITPENRIAILNIKNDLFEHPKYRKDFVSVDIYNAVIEGKVHNTQEFKDLLAKRNIIL